ncbi:hypothetical protein [Corynebacterium incognita]|uniref:hypothetical protein n=1 Tax=Corynebacterium incognita TaxID=2754725 RepID=UPI001FE7A236|nr:hypothetical protein [Corynebacterium incognita]
MYVFPPPFADPDGSRVASPILTRFQNRKATALAAAVLSLTIGAASPIAVSAAEQGSSGNEPAAVGPGSSRYLPPVGDGTGNQPHSTDRARLVSKRLIHGVDAGPHKDVWELKIYSPSNDMVVTNRLIAPKGSTPRPTLILLPGADGKKSKRTWKPTRTSLGSSGTNMSKFSPRSRAVSRSTRIGSSATAPSKARLTGARTWARNCPRSSATNFTPTTAWR